jgi:hypothetical protein
VRPALDAEHAAEIPDRGTARRNDGLHPLAAKKLKQKTQSCARRFSAGERSLIRLTVGMGLHRRVGGSVEIPEEMIDVMI